MDISDIRSIMTVIAFATFMAIVIWAWSSGKREDFEEAARLAVDDNELSAVGGRQNLRRDARHE